MITSMREHKGALYLGGVTNNKIGRLVLDGADRLDRSRQLLEESVSMFFRRREKETPTMPLEGALGPNGRLDDAEAFAIAAPEAICVQRDGPLLVSSGSEVLRIGHWGQAPERWAILMPR